MKLFKKTIAILMLVLPIAAQADTPLVQALKVEQSMKDVMTALHDVNADVQSFSQVPNKIRGLTRIGDLWDGKYDGSIVLGNTSYGYQILKNVPGRFYVYAPNLTYVADSQFYPAPGLLEFAAPKVTSINNGSSFRGSTSLGVVDIPECTYIGQYAFYGCTSLTNVHAPKVTGVGSYAFEGCTNLKEFNGQPLTSINEETFYNCTSLTNVTISTNSCTFGTRCFYNCTKLDIKEWPKTSSIYDYCFYGCRSLKDISPMLQTFTTMNSCDYMFQYCSGLTELKSDNLTQINGSCLFANCTSVTNIDFPNLVAIGNTSDYSDYTFANCTSLRTINLPNLREIGTRTRNDGSPSYTFQGCTSLEEVVLPELLYVGNGWNNWYQAPHYVFENCRSMKRFSAPKCQRFFARAGFANCSSLVEVDMPSLQTIGYDSDYYSYYGLFYNCTSLTNLSLPSLKKTYGRWICYNCNRLKRFSAPNMTEFYRNDGTTKTMEGLFQLCTSLNEVTLGLTAANMLAYPNFNISMPNANVVFHCPADAPFNVDVMYVNGKWTAVTNGTFKLMDSIKGTGTQYINTGYVHKTNTVVEVDFAVGPEESPNRWEYVFGTRSDSNIANSYGVFSYVDNSRRWGYQRNAAATTAEYQLEEETRFRAVCITNSCSIYSESGDLLYSIRTTGIPNHGVGPIAIFACNENSSSGGFSPNQWKSKNMRLYRFTVKEDNETILDLVPALMEGSNTTATACLVDLKNNYHPLFNAGTGQFEAGSVTNSIPVPSSGE